MRTQKRESLLKVMAKKELAKIEVIEENNEEYDYISKTYVMSLSVKGLGIYEKAKATQKFINNETKVLEMVLETDLREILRNNGIIPQDGGNSALEVAFAKLEDKGKHIEIRDRYYNLYDEKIVGESPNKMTVIEEDNVLSAAMEIIIYGR